MKGILLAGGNGTRLAPLTNVISKQLLPVYDKPMICYPLATLINLNIRDILIISTANDIPRIKDFLKDGSKLGINISYAAQEEPKGIAEAFIIGEKFIGDEDVCLILGDNIFNHSLKDAVERFKKMENGAFCFAKSMPTESKQYGVIEMGQEGKVLSIEEKPEHPKSDLAQTGIYMYDARAFEFIRNLAPSARGELEVTDLNNRYVAEGTMYCDVMEGWWVDAGTSFDELLRANVMVAKEIKKHE
jgi:glucose-1-phosphate thymidylyltransferase